MTQTEPELTIHVYRRGDHFYANLVANTPEGVLNDEAFFRKDSPFAAVESRLTDVRALAAHRGSKYRGVGRKPRGYRAARYLTGDTRIIRNPGK
jgi:hypothetical protein